MITADQLLAHGVGDCPLQSDWMASQKTRRSLPALVHGLTYMLPFLFLTRNPGTLAFIVSVHFVIDRWQLASYVAWAKNRPWPGRRPWRECTATGFNPDTPTWLAGWLVIIVDNILQVLTNGLALTYIG